MADSPPYPGAPRWVKVFGIIALALVLLFLVRHLTNGGLGGPTPFGHHMLSHGEPPPSEGGH